MIKYIGSKRTSLPRIVDVVRNVAGAATVLDLFSGTSRVGHALKAAGFRVFANDHNAYAATAATCYVQADEEDVRRDAEKLVREFNALPGSPGYFTETFCVKSRFFQPKNGEKVDAVREAIARKGLPRELEAVLLTSLMEAADRVDSTTGVQMAYLKSWSRRSSKDLVMKTPDLLPRSPHGKGAATCADAFTAAASVRADVVYVDPPYNKHSYLGNYHVWESLVRWDKPETYGAACKRTDVRVRKSVFNSRPGFVAVLGDLLRSLDASAIVLSFNDEGYAARAEIETLLSRLWDGAVEVAVVEADAKRYVGARIGIYDPRGKKVGAIGRLVNKEFLFVATRAGRSSHILDGRMLNADGR